MEGDGKLLSDMDRRKNLDDALEKLSLREEKRRNELILVNVAKGERRNEFHIVDLEEEKLLSSVSIQSLVTDIPGGSIIIMGREIYYIGHPISPSAEDLGHRPDIVSGDVHFLQTGVCRLVLGSNAFFSSSDNDDSNNKFEYNKWEDGPCMPSSRIMVGCASLGGILYALGGSMNPDDDYYLGDAFHPLRGHWRKLDTPIPYVSGRVYMSPRVISDEQRRRLLVHLESNDSLYAYYPDDPFWRCIAIKFQYWSDVSALVDDVLYFHHFQDSDSAFLRAYDLKSSSWLKVVHSSYLRWPTNFFELEFDAMLHLGNGILCLATSSLYLRPNPSLDSFSREGSFRELLFVKFQVNRTSPTEVTVTPAPVKIVHLHTDSPVRGFVPLG